jgi:hypothetical protein
MRHDSRASFLARNLATPYLGCEPKARVATTCVKQWFLGDLKCSLSGNYEDVEKMTIIFKKYI